MTPIRRSLPTSGIRIFFDRAQQLERAGHTVLHLEVGMPDWKPPPSVLAETKAALNSSGPSLHHRCLQPHPPISA